jgi:hypothetical protein
VEWRREADSEAGRQAETATSHTESQSGEAVSNSTRSSPGVLVLCGEMQSRVRALRRPTSGRREYGQPWSLIQQRLYLRYTVPVKEIQFLCTDVYLLKRQWKLMEKYFPNVSDATLENSLGHSSQAAMELLALDALADSEGLSSDQTQADLPLGSKPTTSQSVSAASPPGFKTAYQRTVRDGRWMERCSPVEYGGQGLPISLSVLTNEILATASLSVSLLMVYHPAPPPLLSSSPDPPPESIRGGNSDDRSARLSATEGTLPPSPCLWQMDSCSVRDRTSSRLRPLSGHSPSPPHLTSPRSSREQSQLREGATCYPGPRPSSPLVTTTFRRTLSTSSSPTSPTPPRLPGRRCSSFPNSGLCLPTATPPRPLPRAQRPATESLSSRLRCSPSLPLLTSPPLPPSESHGAPGHPSLRALLPERRGLSAR